jgi:hydrogenase maturation protein HypF
LVARVKARVEGRVQGVGFRPAVYRHAVACGLKGYVRNDPQGVTLDVEGEEGDLAAFFERLVEQPPEQARIVKVTKRRLVARGYDRFEVVASEEGGAVKVQLPPDLATCDACLTELHDPADRRHRYPFINCVDCGPRFTIVRALPYDRANTSMRGFVLCESCGAEYEDPEDRRFHAEPNACPACGPRLFLLGPEGTPRVAGEAALGWVQRRLAEGETVAVKGLGGYHLACDALNEAAVDRLRARKGRSDKAFGVMFRDLVTLRRYLAVTDDEAAELASPGHPIVILEGCLNRAVSPDTRTTGVFLPYAPLHRLLLQPFEALVLTSGNLADEPIAIDETQVGGLIGRVADAALAHNRPIVRRCDDSVVRIVSGRRQVLRRARGFVPTPVRIAHECGPILATGGELKNTFCLAAGGDAHVSQHIGDLRDYATYSSFEHEIESWETLLEIRPRLVAHDLHPGYLSTQYAHRLRGVTRVGVQHHHAHVVSVMAEHELHTPVLGIALDGTGYGGDGTVWGGEFLLADRMGFERLAHFKPYPLPGGEKAIEEPWRMAVGVCLAEGIPRSALGRSFGPDGAHGPDGWDAWGAVEQLVAASLNSPPTTSAGRLFDAVAALLGLCDTAAYEAQGAIRLETAAAECRGPAGRRAYPFAIHRTTYPWVLDFGPAFARLVEGTSGGVDVATLAARFHETVSSGVAATAADLCEARGLTDVVLSGGVFQNVRLLTTLSEALRAGGLRVYFNTIVPPNDGGISLGQAAVAAAREEAGCA